MKSPTKASVRVEAETLEQALTNAAEQLGVDVASLKHRVEQEGARGFLGIGRKPFVVTASASVGTIRHRLTRKGLVVRISPPMTPKQALAALRARGVSCEEAELARAVAQPNAWVRVGNAAPLGAEPEGKITIAPDEMKAFIELGAPSSGGLTFEPEELVKLLRQRGVIFGIQSKLIADALDEERFGEPVLVAQGKVPEHGANATIRYHFRTEKSQHSFVEDERGHIDFRELGLFDNVSPEQILAEKVSATRGGAPGHTVTGAPIEAKDGVDETSLRAGKSTVLSADGRSLRSTITGQVVLVDGVVNVEPVVDIKGDVDFKTGNIESLGSVVVHGNVADGFHIKAKGNIDVQGMVESAHLEAKGDIVIRKGILGKGVATVSAGGDVVAKFVDRATVCAGRDAIIGGEILTSTVRAGRRVKCEGGHGNIIGGSVHAQESVSASTIGSRIGVATVIAIGVSAHERGLVLAAREAEETRGTKMPDDMRSLAERMKRAVVAATKTTFPGVRLAINGAAFEVLDEARAARFIEKDGAVVRE